MCKRVMLVSIAVFGTMGAMGCSKSRPQGESKSASAPKYVLDREPAGATSVSALKESSKDGEEVVLVGRIGGELKPFVDGRAAFRVVDTSLVPCSEREDDACPTPWDYCCDTDVLAEKSAMVRIVEENGTTVKADARTELGLKELDTVVVAGKAKRDAEGNLTVQASGVFVRR